MLKAGFFETDITPPLGATRPADYSKLLVEKIHGSLKARAVVFSDGITTHALVGVDTCFVGKSIVKRIHE